MTETCIWLRSDGNSSDSLAQDMRGSRAPWGVSGLRYLRAVQRPLPDTFIGTNDAG